jgi:hypothetical protein
VVEFLSNLFLNANFADLQSLVSSVVLSELATIVLLSACELVDGLHALPDAICLTETFPAAKTRAAIPSSRRRE